MICEFDSGKILFMIIEQDPGRVGMASTRLLLSTIVTETLPKKSTPKTFGRLLTEILMDMGLKQKELAGRSRLTETQVSRILNNRVTPTLRTTSKIIIGLGWNEDDPRAQQLVSLTKGRG